ncbi:YhdH/YhfP family quinone oxidoreductase [Allopusillimonas ginsengisoli]|uniref:YhdH/YhfP family quinone oxidoreductase n=1 Tax=Allopusillimonas ginsengisoli TaxID=453575 RepID=UPI0010C1DE89|nr:acryloyl-CoA reductase [Allopusillimonas ginsengisoli]
MIATVLPETFTALRTDYVNKQVVSKLVTMTCDELSAGDVVIRNKFAGVNYKDCLAIQGKAKVITSYPRIAGVELVGEVVQSSTDAFVPGQAVMVHGFQTGIAFDGGFSEYSRVPAAHIMPLPETLSPWQAAMIGMPGYTAALVLDQFQQRGITPESGLIALSGASGAVGTLAMLVLSRAGYQVAALTRRVQDSPKLTALGAAEVIDANAILEQTRLLEQPRFAAAIDNISGPTLSWLLRSLQDGGALASVGNASGNNFETNILPFILREITMFGVMANSSWPVRARLWNNLATSWRPDFSLLEQHVRTIGIHDLMEYSQRHLEGKTTGRTVIHF